MIDAEAALRSLRMTDNESFTAQMALENDCSSKWLPDFSARSS